MMTPPMVKHYFSFLGVSHKEIAEEVVAKFRLKKEEAELLMLYCCASDGFAPSKAYIAQKTSITTNNIPRARKKLVDNGFIGFDKDANEIQIDWEQLRALASIPIEMLGKRKHQRIGKVDIEWKKYIKSKPLPNPGNKYELMAYYVADRYPSYPIEKEDCMDTDWSEYVGTVESNDKRPIILEETLPF